MTIQRQPNFDSDKPVRPTLQSAWASFDVVYGDGSLEHVANLIGGKVKVNIDGGFFQNGCAIRMSYVLNNNQVLVPERQQDSVSGADGKRYIYRVQGLLSFLNGLWGKPDELLHFPREEDVTGLQGLLIFEVSGWSDASGHATLWNGQRCSDHGYFDKAQRCSFWALP